VIDDWVDRLPPRGHGLFPGVGEPDHLTRGGRVRVRAWLRYGDCRDWPAVDTAAREISGGTDRRRHEKAEEPNIDCLAMLAVVCGPPTMTAAIDLAVVAHRRAARSDPQPLPPWHGSGRWRVRAGLSRRQQAGLHPYAKKGAAHEPAGQEP